MNPIKAEQDYGAKALVYCKSTPDMKDKRQTIRPGSEEWRTWERYFIGYLGFEPAIMKAVRGGRFTVMTVPAQWPEWFDGDYAKHLADGASLSFVHPQPSTIAPHIPQHRATVYVPADNVLYPQMVDHLRNADAGEYRYDQERGGIWVVRAWLDDDRQSGKTALRMNKADLQRIYAANDKAAA